MRTLGVALLLFVGTAFGGCNVRSDGTSTMKEDSVTPTVVTPAAVKTIVENKCYACHGDDSLGWGGMTYINDLGALVTNGKVVRGTPEQQASSPMLVRVTSTTNPMPPVVAPLDADAKQAITAWILADSPLTDTAGAEHPLATAAKASFDKFCVKCHGPTAPGTGEGNINFITDLPKLVAKNKVKRGDEAARKKSRILVRIVSEDNPMPPVVPALEPGEIETLKGWILSNSPTE